VFSCAVAAGHRRCDESNDAADVDDSGAVGGGRGAEQRNEGLGHLDEAEDIHLGVRTGRREMSVSERGREREREGETNRQTERQIDREERREK